MFLFSTLLFFVLTPGILLTIPKKSSKTTVALVHALVFATVWSLTHKCVWYVTEGFAPTDSLAVLEGRIRANQDAIIAATKLVAAANADYNIRKSKSDYYAAEFAKYSAAIVNAKTQSDKDIANKRLNEINRDIPSVNASTTDGKVAIDRANTKLKNLRDELTLSKLEYDKAKNAPAAPVTAVTAAPATAVTAAPATAVTAANFRLSSTTLANINNGLPTGLPTGLPNVGLPTNSVTIAQVKPANPALIAAATDLSVNFANFAKALSTPY